MVRHRCCAVLMMLGVLFAAGAQAAPARSLRFDQLGVDQGLAQESVLAIAQDRQGFMWFGSQAGLSRFDGYRVTAYKNSVSDARSLADNWVSVLHVDGGGRLWVGTDGGLDSYDPASQSFVHLVPNEGAKRGNGNRHVKDIIDDGGKGLWIATSDGLQHLDTASGVFGIWHHDAKDPASLADDHVMALARDGAGRLWVGTATGLDRMTADGKRFEHFKLDAGAKFNVVQALLADADHNLWIGTLAGMERWKLSGETIRRERLGPGQGLKPGQITALYQDVDGTIWAGSYADGLYRWQREAARFAQYPHQAADAHSVADNQISALYRDRVGTFWVGTWYAGVSRVDMASGGFARFVKQADDPHTLSDNKVRAIADDGRGQLWLGTNDGLDHLDPLTGEVRVYRRDPARADTLNDIQATSVARDGKGILWIGGRAGINSFDPATGRYTSSLSLADGDPESDNVRNIVCDRAGLVWIASRGGLHRLDPATREVTTYRHDPADASSLADNVVRPMLEDRRGRFWVGTFNGLDLLDRASGRFRHFHHDARDPRSLSHDEVHYLFEDKVGTIWVGTAGGLNRMEENGDGSVNFQRYTRKDGLADDSIAAILADEHQQLWVSTNSGISRFDPLNGSFRNYSSGDGTIEGAYFDGAALRGADGTLYFGGFNGMTAFAPSAIRDNHIAPRPVITDFQIFNTSIQTVHPGLVKGAIDTAREVTLHAGDSVFSLEFSGLHYAAPQRNRFAYQLEGFDENWVVTDATKRFTTYTNLDPGSYVFRVKAANKDGVWSDAASELQINILPPYWKSWWFRTLLVLLMLGSAAFAYRVRVRALRRQQVELAWQVKARTAEVEQKNRLLEAQKHELELQRLDAEQRRADAERQKVEVERQKENVEQAHRNISVLSEIGREMTATLNLETIMMTVYRHVHHLMDARIFGIGFYREDQRAIEFPFSMEQGIRAAPYSRSVDDPNQFAVWCLQQRRVIFINDLNTEYANYLNVHDTAELPKVMMEDPARKDLPQSIMYAPLIVKDHAMGVICVQSLERNAYRRVHLDMLQTLAAHAAVALDNAGAYQQLEETQAQLLARERQVRLQTEELALANRALQENDERLRLAKQRAEEATRQKSEFLANMSHEMRTPLAGVIGMLGFALRDNLLQDSTRDQIQRGQANAQSLLTIINDLLDLSKIEAGKLTIENIDFGLHTLLDNVTSLFEEQAAERSIDFGLALDEDLPPFVVGDPTRLRQVLVNLVGNAFKFTRRGGVKLAIRRLPGDQTGDGRVSVIRFSVSDTGIGIPAEAIPRLFQKFEQADTSTTRRYGGTGLGLAICRQLVELMGGAIEVESEEGRGSTFSFVLPLPDGVPPPLLPHVPRAAHSHRLRVLCAEDFPTNQIIIRMMLEELGHKVDIAENGLLALAACARTRYDLILMDGRMPEMDGATATRLIRSGGPAGAPVLDQEMMIVALTANASEEDRSRYLGAGMDDFLTKPIDEAALHLQLSRAIERQLQRGVALPLMSDRDADQAPSTSELDALFGMAPEQPAPAAPAAHPARRASDLKARMRAAFAGDVGKRLAELDAAIAQADHDGAGRLLHGIKGSAAYLDETELHVLCGALELAADARRWDEIAAALPRLHALLADFAAGQPLRGENEKMVD